MQRLWLLLSFITFIIRASDALGSNDPIGTGICEVLAVFRSDLIQIIQLISVIALGIQVMRGKLRWETAVTVIVAIIIMSYSYYIVAIISGVSMDSMKSCTTLYSKVQDDSFARELCKLMIIFSGNAMRVIAIMGISALGIQSLRGKLKWEVALMVVVGIILMFKAPQIIFAIRGHHYTNSSCESLLQVK
ncbi:TrbC/VirB2 family protein [Rickettsia endosymbiont of Halotydeus destructor]|uniref:TrbC/VirB2 family protein n=1 Tax=Rickettsia endosymbiont of Halotydeus destructor TaxID=2996754 RepID=UPI003BAF0977